MDAPLHTTKWEDAPHRVQHAMPTHTRQERSVNQPSCASGLSLETGFVPSGMLGQDTFPKQYSLMFGQKQHGLKHNHHQTRSHLLAGCRLHDFATGLIDESEHASCIIAPIDSPNQIEAVKRLFSSIRAGACSGFRSILVMK